MLNLSGSDIDSETKPCCWVDYIWCLCRPIDENCPFRIQPNATCRRQFATYSVRFARSDDEWYNLVIESWYSNDWQCSHVIIIPLVIDYLSRQKDIQLICWIETWVNENDDRWRRFIMFRVKSFKFTLLQHTNKYLWKWIVEILNER